MRFEEFKKLTTEKEQPPQELPELLLALWREAQGDWEGAHRIAQGIESSDASWVHAHLHRKEGDLDNARYWYRRTGKPECRSSLDEEWEQIARHLIEGAGFP